MKKNLLLFISVVLFLSNSFSQGHTEDFNDGDLVGWWNQADYTLTNTGSELEVVSKKVAPWNGFTYTFAAIDITDNPYVSIKVKTDFDFNLNFFINTDKSYGGGKSSKYQEIVRSENFVEYTFDFSGAAPADLSDANVLNFVFNPSGANTCNATVIIDEIRVGDAAVIMPAITRPQDQFHVMNAPEVTVPLWGILQRKSGTVSISATSSNTALIPHPTVEYNSPEAAGSLMYTPVANELGAAEITVIVTETGAADNVFSFFVNIEKNLAPKVDSINDINVKADLLTGVTISGLSDGNPNAKQKLSITASSSDVGIMPDPEVTYENGSFIGVVNLLPIDGQTGTVTVTITVKDDGGTLNGGVDSKDMVFDVTVYEEVNNPPVMNSPFNVSILENSSEYTTPLTGISDGDKAVAQTVTITAISSNPSLIPNPTVVYTPGSDNGVLLYTPVTSQLGTATITVTLTDDGGLPSNNGNESTVYIYDVNVRVAPITGWFDEFDDGELGQQWPDVWGDPGEDTHLCTESGGSMKIQIDKTRTNGKWSGLWFNIPTELDLYANPYISIRMKIDAANNVPNTEMLIFLWDAYDHYNTAKTIRYTVTETYIEYFFDYSDPSYQLQEDGTAVDLSRIKALLFNFDPGGDSPLLQGSFYFDDLRIGDQANKEVTTPFVVMDSVPDYAIIKDAGEQVLTITGLTDGDTDSNTVSIVVTSSNISLIPTPTSSAISNGITTLTYTPTAGQTGKSTITITASASGSTSAIQTFTIDVMDLNASIAEAITIDMTTEYQEIDGFGAYMGSGATSTETVINLAKDMGMSMARIGLVGGGFEEVNDNSDPNIINLDAFNPSAFSLENIRRIAPFVDKFILTIWSPAGWMKTNKTELGVTTGANDNKLEPRYYEEYAEEIVAAIQIIKRETGVELYAIGLHNEPEFNEPYASCKVTWDEFRDVIKVVGKRLDDEGLGHIQLYFAEALPIQDHLDEYMDAVKNDPKAEGYADIAALHNYDADGSSVGGAGCSDWKDFYNRATTGGTGSKYKTWMTETSGHADNWNGAMTLAGNIFNALRCGNASAWLFWTLSAAASSPEYGLIVNNKPTSRYYISKQYYKYIRPGAIRVGVASAGIPSIAFKDDVAKTVSVILFNNTDTARVIEIGGDNLPTQWKSYTTSSSRNCERGLDVVADGLIIIPPNSLTTLIGNSANFPPSINEIDDQTLLINSPEQVITLTGISDGEQGTQTLVITAASSNQDLIPDPVINYVNGDATAILSYIPTAELMGSAEITVTLIDDGLPQGKTVKTFTINVQSEVDVNDEIEIEMSLYPNPATNFVNINMGGYDYKTLVVTDINGSVVSTINVSGVCNEYQLNVSRYHKGAYVVTLTNDEGSYSSNFIVE